VRPGVPRSSASGARSIAFWILIGGATGGAWIFYFADAPTLLMNFVTGNAFVAYITVAILTATTYTSAG
jgi:polyferredoxin